MNDNDDNGNREDDAAQVEMRRLEGMRLSQNTQRTYKYCMGKFIGWLMKFAHLAWSADSMIIWFDRMKNDQGNLASALEFASVYIFGLI